MVILYYSVRVNLFLFCGLKMDVVPQKELHTYRQTDRQDTKNIKSGLFVLIFFFLIYIIFIEIYHLQSSYYFIDNIIYRLK